MMQTLVTSGVGLMKKPEQSDRSFTKLPRLHGADPRGIRKLESRLKLLEEGKEASRRAKALESEADGLRSSVAPGARGE